MPFQRLYIVHTPKLIQVIQSKTNAKTFLPNLLDFGMLFSGVDKASQRLLRGAFSTEGNSFTMSVHKYLVSGPSLEVATKMAIDRLSASLPKSIAQHRQGGLLDAVRHELTLALTGAIYGEENPYDDPEIEKSWWYVVRNLNEVSMTVISNGRTVILYQVSAICYTARSHTSQRAKR